MLEQRCDELARAVQAQDASGCYAAMQLIWQSARDAGQDELSPALAGICRLFDETPLGLGGQLSVLAGALVECGADPAPLLAPAVDGLVEALELAARFAAMWEAAGAGDLPEPEKADGDTFDDVVGRLSAVLSDADEAHRLADGWYSAGVWAMPMTTLLQSSAVRAALPQRVALERAVTAAVPNRDDLTWLVGLLAVLDDEPLVVLHRASGRGYHLTIGGIGDNFQLHTLIAATLSGPAADGLLEGVRPKAAWVAAATDGPWEPDGGIRGQFNLVDGYGGWIWNEGKPADIPLLEGRRVVVLDPPPYERSWNIGRGYPMMHPAMRFDRLMAPAEAAAWLAKVQPSRL